MDKATPTPASVDKQAALVAKLRYMGKQYAAGQVARGGAPQKHYLEEAADEIEMMAWALSVNKVTPESAQENAALRNVIQAACIDGLPGLARAWEKYFPDHPITIKAAEVERLAAQAAPTGNSEFPEDYDGLAHLYIQACEERDAQAPVVQAGEPGKYDDVLKPFFTLMERELHANSGKGDRPGWLAMKPDQALLEVYHHVAKLAKAVRDNDGPGIMEYGADVANMAMMVLDLCGSLAWVDAYRASSGAAQAVRMLTREEVTAGLKAANAVESTFDFGDGSTAAERESAAAVAFREGAQLGAAQAAPMLITEFNVGRFCLSEDDCIAQGIDFSAYERGVADAAEAFSRNA